MTPGKTRSVGVVLLLFIVTLGVYWFVWLYKALGEAARDREIRANAGRWVAALATLTAASFVLGSIPNVVSSARASEEFQRTGDFQAYLEAASEVPAELAYLAVIAGAIGITFYALQAVYLSRASRWLPLRPGSASSGAVAAMAVGFCAFGTFRQVLLIVQAAMGDQPLNVEAIIGGVSLLATIGYVTLVIIWVVQVQSGLNAYWSSRPVPYPPDAGWISAPAGAPTQAPAADEVPTFDVERQPDDGSVERPFKCPDCGTQISVRYRPGEATDVRCPGCGTRGIVR